MRRVLGTVQRAPLSLLAVVYVAGRMSVSIGRTPARFPDTAGWTTLDFWGANERLWPVPLVFEIAGSDAVRVGVHVAVGSAAWILLAVTLARASRFPRTIAAATLAVGLAPQVTRWDLAILSESLGISLVVVLLAVSVRLVRGDGKVVAWLAAAVAVGLTRPLHVAVLTVAAAAASVVALRSRGARMAVPAVVLCVASTWGWVQVRGNDATSRLNVYTVLAFDVMPDDERFAWFVARGMPDVPGMRDALGYDFAGTLPPDVAAIVDLPVDQVPPSLVRAGGVALAEWVRDDGVSTVVRWALSHPGEAWSTVSARADSVLSPPNDDFLPLESRVVMARVVFGPWEPWVAAWAVGTTVCLARRRSRRGGLALMGFGAAILAVHSVTMLTSGIEHQRHAATTAVAVRIAGLAALALAAPARITPDGSSDGAPDARTRRGGRGRRGRARTSRPTRNDTADRT